MTNEQGVFVISLDAVDLSLLPTNRMSRHNKIAPLWTKNNLNTKNEEYYEFKISTVESKQNCKDQSPNLEIENSFCHICNIEVPQPFLSEHRTSIRHKTNMKIAMIALQRIIKNLNDTHDTDDHEINPSVHFCPTCITVIDIKYKDTHDKSIHHKNSLAVDKILNDFLILYEGNLTYGIEDDMHKHDKTDDVDNVTQNSNESDFHDSLKNFVGASLKKNDVTKKLMQAIENPIHKPKSEVKNATVNTIDKKVISLDDYIALIYDRCKKNRMYLKVIDNVLEIQTVDGSVVKVTDTNFHGFNKMQKKYYQCFVCNETFKEKQMEKHKLSHKHLEKMCLPLKDKHCVRQIADNLCHCVVCNKVIECADFHILCNRDHNNSLKQALVSDKLNDNNWLEDKNNNSQADDPIKFKQEETIDVLLKKGQKSFTQEVKKETDLISDERVNKQNIDVKSKYEIVKDSTTQSLDRLGQTMNVNNKYMCGVCSCYVSIQGQSRHNTSLKHNFNLQSEFHYLMQQITSDEVICRICDSSVVNNVKHVMEHVSNIDHINKYNLLLVNHKIKKINENEFYCKLCEEYVSVRSEMLHIKEKKHLFNCHLGDVDEIIKVIKDKGDDENDDIFEIVYDSLSDEVTIKSHTSDDGINKETIESETGDETKYKESAKSHTSEDGINKEAIETPSGDVNDKVDINTLNDDENERGVIEFHYCNVCNVKVPNYDSNLQEHDKGRAHTNNMSKLTNQTLINTKTINEEINADTEYVIEQSEFPGVVNCVVCKLHIINDKNHITLHASDAKHLNNYGTFLRDNHLTQTTNNVYCNLCAVYIGIKSEIIHVKGRKHIQNLANKIPSPNIVISQIDSAACKANDEFKGTTASVSIENTNTLSVDCTSVKHMNLKPEMLLLLARTDNDNVLMCKICKVKIPLSEYNIRTHINGSKHIQVHKTLLLETQT